MDSKYKCFYVDIMNFYWNIITLLCTYVMVKVMNLFSEIKIVKLDAIDSTNEYAKKIVSDRDMTDEPLLIIADEQTSGKTTKKTAWYSPKGNLYMTFVLNIKSLEEKFFPQLSFISALSLVEVLKEYSSDNASIKVKWPNDVLLDEKKLSGILIEKHGDCAIIGIGVNVISHPDIEYTGYATVSLQEKNINVEKNNLGDLIAKRIIDNVNICIRDGFERIIDNLKPFMIKLSEEIDFEQNGKVFSGIFSGINKNGGLCLKQKTGEEIIFYSGNMCIYKR